MISKKDRANHYTVEYDARNPRLRMNILGFLLSEGEAPNAENVDEYLVMVDKMVTFITNDVEPFAGLVESLDEEADEELTIDVLDEDEDNGKGFKYL